MKKNHLDCCRGQALLPVVVLISIFALLAYFFGDLVLSRSQMLMHGQQEFEVDEHFNSVIAVFAPRKASMVNAPTATACSKALTGLRPLMGKALHNIKIIIPGTSPYELATVNTPLNGLKISDVVIDNEQLIFPKDKIYLADLTITYQKKGVFFGGQKRTRKTNIYYRFGATNKIDFCEIPRVIGGSPFMDQICRSNDDDPSLRYHPIKQSCITPN